MDRRSTCRIVLIVPTLHAVAAVAETVAPLGEITITDSFLPVESGDEPATPGQTYTGTDERSGGRTLGDLLSATPGIQANPQAYIQRGSPQGVQIWGCDPTRVLVLVDGQPILGTAEGIVDTSQLPLSNIESVKIVKGSASALYGSNAICGTVLIRTRKPPAQGHELRLQAEAGSHQSRFLASNLRGAISPEFRYALQAEARSRASYDLDTRLPDTNGDALRSWSFTLGATAALSPETELGVLGGLSWNDEKGISTLVPPGLERTYLRDERTTVRRPRLGLNLIHSFSPTAKLTWETGWSAFSQEIERRLRDSEEAEWRTGEGSLLTSQLTLQTLLGMSHDVTLGTEVRRESLVDEKETLTVNPRGGLNSSTLVQVPEKSMVSADVFAQDDHHLTETWRLTPGARFSWNQDFGTAFTGKLAAHHQMSPMLALRASYGQGFRAPTLKQLHFTFSHNPMGRSIEMRGNPDLRPERSQTVTAGADGQFGEGHSASATVHFSEYRDLIDSSATPTRVTDTADIYTYENFDRARTYGVELSAATRPLSDLRLNAGYNLLWARNLALGTSLPNRPRNQIQASIAYLRPSWRLTLSSQTQSRVWADAANTATSPAFTVVTVEAEKAVHEAITLYARIQNATDVVRNPNDLNDFRPEPGRQFFVGIRSRLGTAQESVP